jgi:DNA-binding transcriptional MerR regulator
MEKEINQPVPGRHSKKYFSEAEVAAMFEVSLATLRRWRRTNMIGFWRTPGSQTIRFTAQHLDDFEKRHDHKAKGRRK